jgi:Fur family ferric uptake transcriptional regulator
MAYKNSTSQAKMLLKTAGFNITKAQIFIIQELLKAKGPLSRKELVQKLGKNCPDKITVYRIMEKFCMENLVHKAFLKGRAWKYELAHNCSEKQCHPHFTCVNCGETFCLTNLSLPLIKGLKKGFVFHRQQVRVDGLCSSCS